MGMIFIGVDPGLSGCLCVLDPDKNEVQFFDAPVLEMVVNKKNKRVLDAYRMVQILKDVSAGRQVMGSSRPLTSSRTSGSIGSGGVPK